jgi:hypothetical protein
MSKPAKRVDTPGQGSLLDLLARAQLAARTGEGPAEGSLNVQHRLVGAINKAIKECSLSRWEIAGKMSELMGAEISKHMLDAWTSEAKEYHRFPAEYLPAFCQVTGNSEPLRVIAEAAGLFVVEGPDALRSEIQALDEKVKKINAEKKRRLDFLKSLEKGERYGER